MNKETFPIWKPSPNRAAIGFSQNAFSITVLPKDDHTDFAQQERLALPCWTMILAICVVVTNPIVWTFRFWNFQYFVSIFHFHLGTSRYCVRCLSCASWQSGFDIHDFCCCQFVILMILVRWILHQIQNHLSQYRLGIQLDLCIFGAFVSNSAFFKWHMSINDAKWTVAPDVLVSSKTSFLLLTFVKFHAEILSNFPILYPLLPLLRESSWLEALE